MRFLVSYFAILVLVLGRPALPQHSQGGEQRGFSIASTMAKPEITGPEDITALAHVIEQPDSPLEILTLDFSESFLSVANERHTEQFRCTMKIHNRSDQWIRGAWIEVLAATVSGGGGTGLQADRGKWGGLAPGQQAEVRGCGGSGSGGASGNHVRILIFVRQIEMDDCFYVPSKRLPYELGVSPVGL